MPVLCCVCLVSFLYVSVLFRFVVFCDCAFLPCMFSWLTLSLSVLSGDVAAGYVMALSWIGLPSLVMSGLGSYRRVSSCLAGSYGVSSDIVSSFACRVCSCVPARQLLCSHVCICYARSSYVMLSYVMLPRVMLWLGSVRFVYFVVSYGRFAFVMQCYVTL